ncbi:MAG: epimerase [Dehalococcoidia bacterium]|nr:epimerase [Dehalococcoidia bacterium]
MRILFIGGTRFVGLHMVREALARGHEAVLFNRGTNPDAFPGVEQLHGDRDGDLAPLRARTWDAVVDTPGYVPRVVAAAADALRDVAARYCFISTLSVYADFSRPGIDEHAPLATVDAPDTEDVTGATYGGLKALCEARVTAAFGDRALLVRPGYVVGPEDPTDRFTYYPVRAARGDEMLAPGEPGGPLQVIDARDLAAFTIGLVEFGASGAYNATGPGTQLTWGEFLAACTARPGAATVSWAPEPFLAQHNAIASGEFPLWAPAAIAGLHQVSIAKALAAGLAFRPLAATIEDTLVWRASLGRPLAAGPSPEREAALLAALRSGSAAP